jgi:hypothetical protein
VLQRVRKFNLSGRVWRTLSRAGLLRKWNGKPSKKGTGFEQPPQPHQHWHIDVSYLNVCATFYYLCSILDGYNGYPLLGELKCRRGKGWPESSIRGAVSLGHLHAYQTTSEVQATSIAPKNK